ncbi:MAG: hypothetical protein ACYCO3_15250, partial [Mycobacteriales bacterium]
MTLLAPLAESSQRSAIRSRMRSHLSWIAASATYLLLACLLWGFMLPWSNTQIANKPLADTAQEVWFLAWTQHALWHLQNPFFTRAIFAPTGGDLASSTSMVALGTLLSPLTAWLGPVATYNLALRLGFAASAFALFAVLRACKLRWPAAILAGALYGFSPFAVGEATAGHLFLLTTPLLPVWLFLIYRALAGERRSRLRDYLLVGVLAGLQFLTSAELLADAAVVGATCLLAALLATPRRRAMLAQFARLAVGGAVGFAAVAGYPLWAFTFGPHHVSGPTQPVAVLDRYSESVVSLVLPTISRALAPAGLAARGTALVAGNLPENGLYLGIPLLASAIVIAFAHRREPLVRLASVMGLAGLLLCLGPRLHWG